jgi:hypothetical protein
MSISQRDPHRTPAEVLADAVDRVRELADRLWSAQSDQDLIETVEQAEALRSAVAAVQAGAVAEADARDLAKTVLGYGSTGDWLTHVGGLRRGEGRRRVKQARVLTSAMTATRHGLVEGVVSPEQAEVIVAAVDRLPSGLRVRVAGEARLVADAGSLDATELVVAGRRLVPRGRSRRRRPAPGA